jgi:large subunit ribosomal protein L17e
MERVIAHEQIIPFRRYNKHVARHAQVRMHKWSNGRWPEKSCKAVRELLINLKSNAETKGLDPEKCVVSHVAVQRAVNGRRRTFRAHGRITPYISSNCHIELHCVERTGHVAKADKPVVRVTKKQAARQRLAIGK